MITNLLLIVGGVGIFGLIAYTSILFVPQGNQFVVERLGRPGRVYASGVHVLMPFLDAVAYRFDIRETVNDVPPLMCHTNDHVQITVDGIVYYRIVDPLHAAYNISSPREAIGTFAQTVLRTTIGSMQLLTTFSDRNAVNSQILTALQEATNTWGIQVVRYEVQSIQIPDDVRTVLEQQLLARRNAHANTTTAKSKATAQEEEARAKKVDIQHRSRGDASKIMSEAKSKAANIKARSQAFIQSLEKLSVTASGPFSNQAFAHQLFQEYTQQLQSITGESARVFLPVDLSKPSTILSSVDEAYDDWVKRFSNISAAGKEKGLPPYLKQHADIKIGGLITRHAARKEDPVSYQRHRKGLRSPEVDTPIKSDDSQQVPDTRVLYNRPSKQTPSEQEFEQNDFLSELEDD